MSTVLMVDDNASLAYFTARLLQRGIEGLNVVTAMSAAEARSLLQKHNPDVLIADFGLPDGNGVDLIRELAERNPGMATILISGDMPSSSSVSDMFGFLLKPYEAETLVNLVKRALDSGQPHVNRKEPEAFALCEGYDRHQVQNRLGGLIAGLRALEADLRAEAYDPTKMEAILNQYLDSLCQGMMEVSQMLPVCPRKGETMDAEREAQPSRHGSPGRDLNN